MAMGVSLKNQVLLRRFLRDLGESFLTFLKKKKNIYFYLASTKQKYLCSHFITTHFYFIKYHVVSLFTNCANHPRVNRTVRKIFFARTVPGGIGFRANLMRFTGVYINFLLLLLNKYCNCMNCILFQTFK